MCTKCSTILKLYNGHVTNAKETRCCVPPSSREAYRVIPLQDRDILESFTLIGTVQRNA